MPSLQNIKKIEEKICFRDSVSDIPSTTYGSFGLYRYPAKFIPQIIAFILQRYGHRGISIIDPFAGSGTTGLVSRMYGFDYELWDLNPITQILHEIAIMPSVKTETNKLINKISLSKKTYIPEWSKLSYWFPEQALKPISSAWGFYYKESNPKTKKLLLVPLLKITRKYSYNDQQRQKLSKSPMSIKKVDDLLDKKDWQSIFYKSLAKEIEMVNKKLDEYNQIQTHKNPTGIIKSGIDGIEESKNLKGKKGWDFLITSPPYLQAQEYIRNSKMDLFWLGFNEEQIKQLSKKELPYRKVEEIKIHSLLFSKYRNSIKEDHLRKMYDRYFYGVLGTLTRLSDKVSEYLFLFVGPASVRSIPIPIDKIFIEHFTSLGWKHEKTYIDSIVSRVLFKSKTNPATGLKENRIPTERLVVLKRK